MLEWLRDWWARWFGGPPPGPLPPPDTGPPFPPTLEGPLTGPQPPPQQMPLTPTTVVGVHARVMMICHYGGGMSDERWISVTVNAPAGATQEAIETAIATFTEQNPSSTGRRRTCPNPEIVEIGDFTLYERSYDDPAIRM